MYEKLISSLRICQGMCEGAGFEEAAKLLAQAADAIEKLSKERKTGKWKVISTIARTVAQRWKEITIMKLFKTTDEKLLDLGFKKVRQNDFGAGYERTEPEGYTHVVDLVRKKSGRHSIDSYSEDDCGPNYTNACVGLTYHEAKLFLRKMNEIGLRDRRR